MPFLGYIYMSDALVVSLLGRTLALSGHSGSIASKPLRRRTGPFWVRMRFWRATTHKKRNQFGRIAS